MNERYQIFSKIRPAGVCKDLLPVMIAAACIAFGACSSAPLVPYTKDAPPLILVPAWQAGVEDKRGRFREIFCAVLEERGPALPDYRPCGDALVRVGLESGGTGGRVELGPSRRRLIAALVPGIGWDCFSDWLDMKNTVANHVQQFGYDLVGLKVEGLSSSARNARLIRDAILEMTSEDAAPRLVLIGYSKGISDVLEALVSYPEIRRRVVAVVSAAGSVGGSPLANDATQSQLELMMHLPKSQCTPGDGGGLQSLRPTTRQTWLAENPLPRDFPYYSLVAYPEPERISSVLSSSYKKLSQVDSRNDSMVLFYDQVIPGSALLAYLNADHWAVSVPVARSHKTIGSMFVDQNDYPREALVEALLRFVEEDLDTSGK